MTLWLPDSIAHSPCHHAGTPTSLVSPHLASPLPYPSTPLPSSLPPLHASSWSSSGIVRFKKVANMLMSCFWRQTSHVYTSYWPHAQERNGRRSQGTWGRPYIHTCTHILYSTCSHSYVCPLLFDSQAMPVGWQVQTLPLDRWDLHSCGLRISPHLLYTLLSEYSWTEIDHPASDKRKAVKFAGWLAGWVEVLHQESIIVRPIILVQLISHDCIRLRH